MENLKKLLDGIDNYLNNEWDLSLKTISINDNRAEVEIFDDEGELYNEASIKLLNERYHNQNMIEIDGYIMEVNLRFIGGVLAIGATI